MNKLAILTLGILITSGGIAVPLLASAEPSPRWEHGKMHEGGMMGDASKMHKGRHGSRHGVGHNWKTSLTDDQSQKLDKLRLSYKRNKYLLKAKLRQAKVEFALLITEDEPNKSGINSKIDQITKLKKEKLHLKANHKINVRKLLTEQQRVQFDLAVLKRAAKGKHRKGGHH